MREARGNGAFSPSPPTPRPCVGEGRTAYTMFWNSLMIETQTPKIEPIFGVCASVGGP